MKVSENATKLCAHDHFNFSDLSTMQLTHLGKAIHVQTYCSPNLPFPQELTVISLKTPCSHFAWYSIVSWRYSSFLKKKPTKFLNIAFMLKIYHTSV